MYRQVEDNTSSRLRQCKKLCEAFCRRSTNRNIPQSQRAGCGKNTNAVKLTKPCGKYLTTTSIVHITEQIWAADMRQFAFLSESCKRSTSLNTRWVHMAYWWAQENDFEINIRLWLDGLLVHHPSVSKWHPEYWSVVCAGQVAKPHWHTIGRVVVVASNLDYNPEDQHGT